jgi:hypothetical protein
MKEFLESKIGIEQLFSYLKNEKEKKTLQTLLIIKSIKQISQYLNDESIIKKFQENFTIESLKEIIREETLNKIKFEKIDKTIVEENLEQVEKELMNTLNEDIIQKYITKYEEKKFKLKKEEYIKKSNILRIIRKKQWVFNKFMSNEIKIFKHDPILLSQNLADRFILFFEKIKFYISMNGFSILHVYEEEFMQIKEMTIDLQDVKVEDLTNEEKLCFYLNIFNVLLIHSVLTLQDKSYSNSEDFLSLINLCSYDIGIFLLFLKQRGKHNNFKKDKR